MSKQRTGGRFMRPFPAGPGALLAAVIVAGTAPASLAAADGESPAAVIDGVAYEIDPERGFRMERYRAPVPDMVPGGTRVDTAFVASHPAPAESILIDVLPPVGMGADPLDGHWIIAEPHATLPGAIWLPEVGFGFLDAAHEDYFRRNLERLTREHPDLPLIFFCAADCWQSWNAAKRAADWGYDRVHWYPEGTDGWREADRPTVPGRPLNFFDDSVPGPDD